MALSQQQVQHLRSLNDVAATCALARIEDLERAAADQELRERTQNINTEQRFHELQARVSAISAEALQYKNQVETLEAQVSSLVVKEKELLARHGDASVAATRESSKAKRLEQQVDELHRDKAELTAAAQRRLEQLDAAGSEIERITSSLQQATAKISELEAAAVRADRLLREKDLEVEKARVSLRMDLEFEKANELKAASDRASGMRREMLVEIEDLKRTLSSKISECESANARAAQDLLAQSQRRDEFMQAKSQVIELKHQLSAQEMLHKLELERRDELVKILEQEKVRLDSEKDRSERNRSALDGQLKAALADLQAEKHTFAQEKAALQSSTQEAVAHAKTLSEELASLSQLRGAIQKENVSFASAQNLLLLSPAAAAASIDRDGSLSKTDLYAKYIEALKVLHTERQERVKVERELSAVVAVMEETGPQVQQELQEGHLAKNAISEMQERLDKAVRENLQKRRELDRCADHVQKLDRENQLLDTNCRRLQKQLRHALNQNEILKKNGAMEALSSLPSDPNAVIDYVWELGGDIEQALLRNEQLQRMIDTMQSDSEKEMSLRKEQRIREAEAETIKLRRELDEMRDAREKQMSLFKALNERCESFKAQLQHRSPAVSSPVVNVTDSPLFQQLLQDKDKLQAEFDAFKEARFTTSRDEIESLRQLVHSAQQAAALAQGRLEGVQMERDTYRSDLATRADELPRMREKCAKSDAIAAQAETNAQMHMRTALQAEERVKTLEFQLHQATMRAEHERARCESLDKDKEALRGEVQRMQELVSKCHASFDHESTHRLAELSRIRDEGQERENALRKAREDLSTARLAAEEHQHSQARSIDLLQQQLDDAERRAKSASDSAVAMKARIASLEASLSDTSVRRSPAPSQHLFLPSIPGAAGEFDQSMVSEIASLQEQLFAAKTERDTYFRMSGEFERELLASSAALKELQASIIAANAQIGQQAQQLSDQVKTSSAAAAEAAAAAAASQAQLQAEVDAANGRAAVAAAAAVSAKEDLEVQIARANNLLQAEAAARASAAAERSRLEAMTQDHAAGISRAQALQKTLSDREEALFRITSELDREKEAAASSLAAASSASKELLDKVRGLETRLSDAQQQNSLLESQLQRLERSLSDHGTPETEAPESEREQRALRAYIERERDRLKLQSEASEASCRRLKFQLDAKEREAAELQAEVELSRQKLSGPCYSQVDLDRIGNMQKQVSLLTESNEHLRSQESSAQKLVLQWEERYNGVQGEMMQLRQAASLHIQLLASAECQRDEYAKSLSELRDQYQRISSKNQDVDPLVHEELKSKHQELEKQYAEAAEKCIRMNTKLNEKKEAQLKHQIAFTDIQQKLQLSQTALTDAQQRHRQQHQELQLQHQQQQEELKQQHHQQQERDRLATSQLEKTVDELKKEIAALRASVPAVGQQHQELQHQHQQQQERDRLAISQLEKTVEELKKELAALRASVPVVGIADVTIPDGSQHKSKPSNVAAAAPPTVAAVGRSVILNPAAAAFGQAGTFQFQPASSVPAATAIADSAVEAESLGEKRSGDTTPAGAKQTKRSKVSFVESPQVFSPAPSAAVAETEAFLAGASDCSPDPVREPVRTPHVAVLGGFPSGELFNKQSAKTLFPNQNVCGIQHLPGKPFANAFFDSAEGLEAALALGSSRVLRDGVSLTVERRRAMNKRNAAAVSPLGAGDSISAPAPSKNPFTLSSPTNPFASSAASTASSNPFAMSKPPPPPGDPPGYSSVFGGAVGLGSSSQFGGSGSGFGFGSAPLGFVAGGVVPSFGASSSASPFSSNPFAAPTAFPPSSASSAASSLPVFGGASFPSTAINLPASSSAAATFSASAPNVATVVPAAASSAGAVPVVTPAALLSTNPADAAPAPAGKLIKLSKPSANILGMGGAASPAPAAQAAPVAPAPAPVSTVSSSTVAVAATDAAAPDVATVVPQPAAASSAGAVPVVTPAALLSTNPADAAPAPAGKLIKLSKPSANILGMGGAASPAPAAQAAPVAPAPPSAAVLPPVASAEVKLSSTPAPALPPSAPVPAPAAAVPTTQGTIRRFPARPSAVAATATAPAASVVVSAAAAAAPAAASAAATAAPATAPVAIAVAAPPPMTHQEDAMAEKQKRVAEKAAAKLAQQAAAAAATTADALAPATAAPIIITSQPLGFTGVPVMNFGSVFQLPSDPSPVQLPGGAAPSLGFSFAAAVFGNEAVAPTAAAPAPAAPQDNAQPDNNQ